MLSLSPVFNYCLFYFHCFQTLLSLLSSFRAFWNEITGLSIPKNPYYSSNISLHEYKVCPHPLLSFILSHWLAIGFFYLSDLSHKSMPPGLLITLFPFHGLALFSSISSEAFLSRTVSSHSCYKVALYFFFLSDDAFTKTSPCYFTFI